MLQRLLQSETMEEELRYKLKASRRVPARLEADPGCRRVGQVSVACLVFGPSGHRAPPGGDVSWVHVQAAPQRAAQGVRSCGRSGATDAQRGSDFLRT